MTFVVFSLRFLVLMGLVGLFVAFMDSALISVLWLVVFAARFCPGIVTGRAV
jgi:hypothetical protein